MKKRKKRIRKTKKTEKRGTDPEVQRGVSQDLHHPGGGPQQEGSESVLPLGLLVVGPEAGAEVLLQCLQLRSQSSCHLSQISLSKKGKNLLLQRQLQQVIF